MTLGIVSAEERLKENNGIKGCIFGKSGIGKTYLLWTLSPETTLFMDMEAGDLSVKNWRGDSLRPRTWQECRDLACFIGGANPARGNNESYSQAHYDTVCAKFAAVGMTQESFKKYETIFVDSITVAGRLSFQWSKSQPQAFSEKTGKPDTRGAYGLHGQEMISWLTQLQHTRGRNIWFVGILDEKMDEFNRRTFTPQIDGGKTGLELPGIVDQVITLTEIKTDEGISYRAFVCHTINPFGYPAKDRSGKLELIEKPHLGELMQKIKGEPIANNNNTNVNTNTEETNDE